jgi:hypothetical protein
METQLKMKEIQVFIIVPHIGNLLNFLGNGKYYYQWMWWNGKKPNVFPLFPVMGCVELSNEIISQSPNPMNLIPLIFLLVQMFFSDLQFLGLFLG